MSTRRVQGLVAIVVTVIATAGIGVALWSLWHPQARILSRSDLDLRDGVLFAKGESEPFEGELVELHPNRAKKLSIEVRDGRADGLSRGWFEDGRIEIEEHFARGISNGRRTRWHSNGQRRSTAMIVEGRFEGLYEEWHPNGKKAAEISFRNGKPDGEARAWAEDGSARPPVHYRDGIAATRTNP